MNTDDLIRAMAQDAVPATSPSAMLMRTLPVAMVVSLIAVWATLGLRSDLGHAMTSAVPLLRHVLTLALFGVALTLGWRILRPEGNARLWPLAVPVLAAAALLVWGLVSTPQEGWQMALEGKTQMVCLIAIPLLSIPPVTALLLAFRQGAVMRPTLGGALAGLAGGGLGAAIYALHCIEDSPLFYVTWYGVAIAIVTAASALIGSRILRW